MSNYDKSMALTGQPPKSLSLNQKLATVLGMIGMGILLLASLNVSFPNKTLWLTVSLLAISFGTIWFSWDAYSKKLPGIKNDGVWFKSISSRGLWGWMSGLALTGFYIILYFEHCLVKQCREIQEGDTMILDSVVCQPRLQDQC